MLLREGNAGLIIPGFRQATSRSHNACSLTWPESSSAARTRRVPVFGLLVTATDGTLIDLAATEAIQARFAAPAGGRFPQARGRHGGGVRIPQAHTTSDVSITNDTL
jgi:hypothetical protein